MGVLAQLVLVDVVIDGDGADAFNLLIVCGTDFSMYNDCFTDCFCARR